MKWPPTVDAMAKIVYEEPDDVAHVEVKAEHVSDSGKVRGVRIKRDDGSYLHVPDTRIYSIEMSQDEGQVDYSTT